MAKCKHSIYDTDPHFFIDPVTRQISTECKKVALIQGDHNSERFTFEAPRYIEGHDLSLCNSVQVHYILVDKRTKGQHADVYEPEDFQVFPEDDSVVVCSWLLSGNATKYAGALSFVVRFACVNEGVVEYAWSSAVYSGIIVSDGINNSDIVVEEYSDILEQWRDRIFNPSSETTRHAFTVSADDEAAYLLETTGAWSEAGGYRRLEAGEYTIWRYPIEDASRVTGALWHGHTAANTLLQVSLDGKKWVTVIDNGENSIGWQRYRELTDHLDFSNSDAEYLYVRIGVSKASSTDAVKYTVRGAWKWSATLEPATLSQDVDFAVGYFKYAAIKSDERNLLYQNFITTQGWSSRYSYASAKWYSADNAPDAIDFGDTDQEISEEFYEYLLANAAPTTGVATKSDSIPNLYSCILNDMPITLDVTYGEIKRGLLPGATEADNGKFLRVVGGQWRAVGGENVISRVHTHTFVVGEDSEKKYLSSEPLEQGYTQVKEGQYTQRFTDQNKRTVLYRYHLANSAQIRGLVWSAVCGQQLQLDISFDGENWTGVDVPKDGYDATMGLPMERRSFDLMKYVGTRGLLCYDDLYIRISDVEPSTGYGGAIRETVHLRTERFDLPFGF